MLTTTEVNLFKTARFCPLFITQFLGAFNDNFFKTTLIMLIAFSQNTTPFNQDTLINLCAALFILPYFLFSAFAGQLADKFEKSKLITVTKLVEVILSILAILGFYLHHLTLLLGSLFLLGCQATFFGPLKYSILPQNLKDSELVGGNGLIEMGTFIAILLGTIMGGLLFGISPSGIIWISVIMLLVSLIGFFSSLFIPRAPSFAKNLSLDWNPFRQTFQILQESYHNKTVFIAIIGISWFWFFGSIFLTQMPNFTRVFLNGDEHVATILLTSFSLGIGAGSVSSEWLSHKKVEPGFVLMGCIGLTLFALDFALSPGQSPKTMIGAAEFLSKFQNWRVLVDGFLMGVSAGIYLVPLYTLLQKKSAPELRSRVIAANNIVNAIFMVMASVIAIVFLNLGFSIPQLFIFSAILNGVMGFYLSNLKSP